MIVLLILVVFLFIFFVKNKNIESFSMYNPSGAPVSVQAPCWIGRLNQGNGLIGDDVLSGYNFYPAY